jgi:hypothetical protein
MSRRVKRGAVCQPSVGASLSRGLPLLCLVGAVSLILALVVPGPAAAQEGTPVLTETPFPTSTPLPTLRAEPTATPSPTFTPEPTATPSPTFTPEPTATPSPTSPPTFTPESTATPSPTAPPTFTPESTATPSPTPANSPTLPPLPSPTFTAEPTATPSPTPPLPPVAVTGRVVIPGRVVPLPVTVQALAANVPVAQAVSGPDGSYGLTLPAASGPYVFLYSAPLCLPARADLTIPQTGAPLNLPEVSLILGDIDGNHSIGLEDATLVGMSMGDAPHPYNADLNGDGQTNVLDLVLVARSFGGAANQ